MKELVERRSEIVIFFGTGVGLAVCRDDKLADRLPVVYPHIELPLGGRIQKARQLVVEVFPTLTNFVSWTKVLEANFQMHRTPESEHLFPL